MMLMIVIKLKTFYPGGCKVDDSYIRIPMVVIPGYVLMDSITSCRASADSVYRALELRNADGSLMAFVCNAMPDSMRETLYDRLKASFDDVNIFKNRLPSSNNQRDERFLTMHFCWWNRYGSSVSARTFRYFHQADQADGLQGDMVPEDVHPHFLELETAEGSRKFNFTQTLPYLSRETFQHEELYHKVHASLGDVFEWIETVVSACTDGQRCCH